MNLPPYGVFSSSYRRLASVDRPMDDWKPHLAEHERSESFVLWRLSIRQLLADTIWPFFDRADGNWKGQSVCWAVPLTQQEIDLLIKHMQGSNSYLKINPKLCPNPKFGKRHIDQYYVEDDPNEQAAVNLRDYVCTLTDDQLKQALKLVVDAYARTKLRGIFWFKNEFVRTRPYQAAFLFGEYNFENIRSYSALHSAFYSGHCFEGIVIAATIAEEWLREPGIYDKDMLTALARFGVDFGDRRVFAGVHYPTDNIASWVMALNLIPHIFPDPDPILKFAKDAILNHSTVYRHVDSLYRGETNFAPAMQLLDESLHTSTSTS